MIQLGKLAYLKRQWTIHYTKRAYSKEGIPIYKRLKVIPFCSIIEIIEIILLIKIDLFAFLILR